MSLIDARPFVLLSAPMIVQCQKCRTKFKLPDDKIQPGGTKVRCGKCGSVFRVMAPKPAPPSLPPDNPVFGGETIVAPAGMLDALERARMQEQAARPAAGKNPGVVVPKNPFLSEPAPAPRPPAAPPLPLSGEKREFFVPPAAGSPFDAVSAFPPEPAPPIPETVPHPVPPAGIFGTETVVAAGGADLDSIMNAIGLEPPASPGRPASGEKREFQVPEQPVLARPPGSASVFGGAAADAAEAGAPGFDELFAGAGSEPAASPRSYATETVVSPPAPLDVDALMSRPPPAPRPPRAPTGEKREFVVPSTPPEPAAHAAPAARPVPEVDVDSLFDGLFVKEPAQPAAPPAPQADDVPAAFPQDLTPDLSGLSELPAPHDGAAPAANDRWADLGADLIGGAGVQVERLATAESAAVPAPQSVPAAPAPASVDAVESVQGAFSDDLARSLQEEINRQFELHFNESPGPAPTPAAAVPAPPAAPPPPGPVENPFAAPFAVGIGVSVPDPLSSPLTTTAPPSPAAASGSTDLLPQIPDSPPMPAKADDPFAGLDLSAPVGKGTTPDPGQPPLSKFGAHGPGGQPPGEGFMEPGFSPKENDLFAQLESLNTQPALGPRIEQLPARPGGVPDPAAMPMPAAGFDLDTGGAASFVQHAAGGAPAEAGAAPSGMHLSEEAVKHARPVISRVQSAVVPAARREMKKGVFWTAAPWAFTVLLLAGALALLGLNKGKVAAANVIANLSPASAGTLNKYSIQGFKLYTTAAGRKVGVVTGNVKTSAAVDPSAIQITFELADYGGFVAFKGGFFPANPLTPEEVYELESQEKAYAKLAERRLKAGGGKWLPFQAVFFDPPERLERFAFRIDVAGVP